MTTTTRTDQRPDVHEMVVVHRAFRRESAAAAGSSARTPEGDTHRAKVVADHLRLCMAGLEMHHTGEDIVLWPLLLERAAPSTGLVETMQAQHHAVDEHVEAITPPSPPGRPTRPSPRASSSPPSSSGSPPPSSSTSTSRSARSCRWPRATSPPPSGTRWASTARTR